MLNGGPIEVRLKPRRTLRPNSPAIPRRRWIVLITTRPGGSGLVELSPIMTGRFGKFSPGCAIPRRVVEFPSYRAIGAFVGAMRRTLVLVERLPHRRSMGTTRWSVGRCSAATALVRPRWCTASAPDPGSEIAAGLLEAGRTWEAWPVGYGSPWNASAVGQQRRGTVGTACASSRGRTVKVVADSREKVAGVWARVLRVLPTKHTQLSIDRSM